jgi:hypothetical protein
MSFFVYIYDSQNRRRTMWKNNLDEIVKENHQGARCWLDFKSICQETHCTECSAFLEAVARAVRKVTVIGNARVPEVVNVSF